MRFWDDLILRFTCSLYVALHIVYIFCLKIEPAIWTWSLYFKSFRSLFIWVHQANCYLFEFLGDLSYWCWQNLLSLCIQILILSLWLKSSLSIVATNALDMSFFNLILPFVDPFNNSLRSVPSMSIITLLWCLRWAQNHVVTMLLCWG